MTLTFFHTSAQHPPTFDALLAEYHSSIAVRHVVAEPLLRAAQTHGVTPALCQQIDDHFTTLLAEGATVVVCTCSTLGSAAETSAAGLAGRVIRIDRPLAEQAIAFRRPILVVATVASTLEPTTDMLREVAQAHRWPLAMSLLVCTEAWPAFLNGDLPHYHAIIAEHIRAARGAAEVIVLAQASMAGAAALLNDLNLPILSSPRLAVEAALAHPLLTGTRPA